MRPTRQLPVLPRNAFRPPTRLRAGKNARRHSVLLYWLLAALLLLLQTGAQRHALGHAAEAFRAAEHPQQNENTPAAEICLDCLALLGIDTPLGSMSLPPTAKIAPSFTVERSLRPAATLAPIPPRCRAPPLPLLTPVS